MGKNMSGRRNTSLIGTASAHTRKEPLSGTERGQEPMQENMQGNTQENVQDTVRELMLDTVQEIMQETAQETAQDTAQENMLENVQDTVQDTPRGRTRIWLRKKKKQRCCNSGEYMTRRTIPATRSRMWPNL